VAKRKASSGFSSKRKRLIWILAVAAVIIILIVYETNQELRRNDNSPTQPADTALMSAERAQSEVRSYYRSHDLPIGWKMGDTVLIAPDRLEVSLFFAPRIGSSRHGQAAPPEDITAENTCPAEDALRQRIERYSLWILVNDKTGLIDSFAC
jgi:hypothetical protein